MSEQSQNSDSNLSDGRDERVKTHLERAWKCLHRATLALEQLSQALAGVSPNNKPHAVETSQRRPKAQGNFCFFDEGYADLKPIISAVVEQSDEKEIYRKPSDLLEVAREVRALPWKIAASRPTDEKDARAERACIGKYLQLNNGRIFTIRIGEADMKVKFEASGQCKTRIYKFTKCQ